MIHVIEGNILEADAEALVNTVNTVGVMGKGIALQFKKAFPEMFKAYEKVCKAGDLEPGKMHVYDRGMLFNPRYVINFPTKRHWKGKSRIEDIEAGLETLVGEVRRLGVKSIAVPPLACGQGGLYWGDVYPRIEAALANLREVEVLVYQPKGAPSPEEMVSRTQRPEMTPSRASVIRVWSEYCILGYELTLIEIQKLLYLLQEAGEPLRLRFQKGTYGPYADNLRHVLHLFEGHFLQGFGEGRNRPKTPLRLLDDAVAEAWRVGEQEPNAEHEQRVQRVFRLIEGFESPYGMELLSTVHWIVTHVKEQATDVDSTIDAMHCWSARKRRTMKPEHIRLAWERLSEQGWLKPA